MAAERDERTINQVLADNLAHFMSERQMTQAALALKAGIGQTTVSMYLNPGAMPIFGGRLIALVHH